MTKSILCAVDVSSPNHDIDVLKEAAKLADMDNAQLDVMTVIPDYGMSPVGGYFDKDHSKKMLQDAKASLNDLVSRTLGDARNARVRHIVAQGSIYVEVLKAAAASGSSLIVVGAHKPDFKDFLLGPNAARIVRHSNCSVFVVR